MIISSSCACLHLSSVNWQLGRHTG